MKIIERKQVDGNNDFKFDNGAWVCLSIDEEFGSWEHQSDEDDEETYSSGSLWVDGKVLTDYDGCYQLPKEVEVALMDLGYSLEEEYE